jgi:hypothetical protein
MRWLFPDRQRIRLRAKWLFSNPFRCCLQALSPSRYLTTASAEAVRFEFEFAGIAQIDRNFL